RATSSNLFASCSVTVGLFSLAIPTPVMKAIRSPRQPIEIIEWLYRLAARALFRFPNGFHDLISMACFQGRFQAFSLGSTRIQAIAEYLEHSDSLLRFDIPLDRVGGDIPGCRCAVGSRPQGGQFEQVFVLLAQIGRRDALAFLDDFGGA